jgi:hypothetical protein
MKDISCMDLYTLLSTEKSNKKFYILLKKLYSDINKIEYTFRKLIKFRNLLNKKLKEIYEKNDFSNEIIISLIFDIIKKSYYLQGKEKKLSYSSSNSGIITEKKIVAKMLNKSNSKLDLSEINLNNNTSSNDIKFNHSEEFESIIEEESYILEESLKLAFIFLMLSNKNDINTNKNSNTNFIENKNNIYNNNKEFLLLMDNHDLKSEEKIIIKKNDIDFNSINKINNNKNNSKRDNNNYNNSNYQQHEISINCINFIHKFMENPIKYINKNQIQTTVNQYKIKE